ncbi:UNKNOWN [Stylonychia lemnae]|uniref:50s ribosomal protein l22 n=1 Tax=Stylonychia lemnae TaxID=5949 RepID=A0A078B206_STYLE|nr:UNKNOWN [Stylonychia lemnae]|eukprot:CDW87373.1 UNKNOWN [Stylonychia lemnae]
MMLQNQMMMRQFSTLEVQQQKPQIKIVKNTVTDDLALLEQALPKTPAPQCFFPSTIVKKIGRTQDASKWGLRYSSLKLNACAKSVRKQSLLDAKTIVQFSNKKGAQIVLSVLEAARANALKKGLAEERLYVKECIVGKALGMKKLDIRGRGKMGMIHLPKSSIRITLEERPLEEFYKDLLKGNASPYIAHVFRKNLYQSNANFEEVRKLSHITTSKGRYYRRVQFKRLQRLIQKEYAKKGAKISIQKIERNLLEKSLNDFLEHKAQTEDQRMLVSQNARQALFEKNYKKK